MGLGGQLPSFLLAGSCLRSPRPFAAHKGLLAISATSGDWVPEAGGRSRGLKAMALPVNWSDPFSPPDGLTGTGLADVLGGQAAVLRGGMGELTDGGTK